MMMLSHVLGAQHQLQQREMWRDCALPLLQTLVAVLCMKQLVQWSIMDARCIVDTTQLLFVLRGLDRHHQLGHTPRHWHRQQR